MNRVLFLSSSDADGGATAWFMNLAETLHNEDDYEVAVIVKTKYSSKDYVYQVGISPSNSHLSRFIKKYIKKTPRDIFYDSKPQYCFFPFETEYSERVSANDIIGVCPFRPDIIVSGLTYGFVNTNTLLELHTAWDIPVFMTAYDANVYTGGCHVIFKCDGFTRACEDCPGIRVTGRKKEISKSFALKRKNIASAQIGVLYASAWSLDNIKRSACFRDRLHYDIGMCINTQLFNNDKRAIAKKVFDLPEECRMVFAGAVNFKEERKGSVLLLHSLSLLWDQLSPEIRDKVYIMIAGKNKQLFSQYSEHLPPFHFQLIDFISDVRLLSLAYQAADVFVCSSIEDAGPMMVSEALSCGTPVVGFPVGLMYDQTYVRDGVTGFVVEHRSVEGMANAISKVLELNSTEFLRMSDACRKTAVEGLSQSAFVANFNQMMRCIKG